MSDLSELSESFRKIVAPCAVHVGISEEEFSAIVAKLSEPEIEEEEEEE